MFIQKIFRQVYGGADEQSDENEDKEEQNGTSTKLKRKRRRHKHPKTTSEQSSSLSIIPKQQQEEEEIVVEKPIEHLENEDIIAKKTKRKRRRIRKSKKSLPSSSTTGEQAQSSTIIEQSEANVLFSLTDEKSTENMSSSSLSTPTQQAEQYSSYFEFKEKQQMTSPTNGMHETCNTFTGDVMNIIENDEKKKEKEEIQPTNSLARPTDTPIN